MAHMTEMQLDHLEKILRQNVADKTMAFSNVARPKPTKASTATQAAWTTPKKAPKASGATEGAWDATDTPGGVSHFAKEVWTKDKICAVAKVVTNVLTKMEFANPPIPKPTKASTATQAAWHLEKPEAKASAGTQGAWDVAGNKNKVSSATQPAYRDDYDKKIEKISAVVKAAIITNEAVAMIQKLMAER
ncbi:MAG: hypothetical protein U0K57_06310 [Lachnospiraceae bacterium]|nr:hypothetical protein [Lachnospiraceae bacterium]